MLPGLVVIEKKDLLDEVKKIKEKGYRLAAVSCEREGEAYEITYNFDLNYELLNLRIMVEVKDTIKSISHIYPAAFLIENEFQDLYGFKFEDLTIDYNGHLYLAKDAPEAPML